MSSKIALLRELLSASRVTRGSIVSLQGTTARVATAQGAVIARVQSGMVLNPGDTVKMQDNLVIGRIRAPASLVVYDL